MEKGDKKNLENNRKFQIFLTAFYFPILIIVITLILFWKEGVYDFCTIYLIV